MKGNSISSKKSDITEDLTREKLAKVMKDSPNFAEDENLRQWYSDYIDLFREEVRKLNEDEKKCVSNAKNFLEPCQIEIFWLKNPSYQLIIQTNFKDRKDKEIIVHGPFNPNDFLEKVKPILKESRWLKKIEREPSTSRYFADKETYGHELANMLHNFVENVQREQFMGTFNDGYTSGYASERTAWCQLFRGNIANCDKKKDVEEIIKQIKNSSKQRIESASNLSPPAPAQEMKYDGFGVHLFPPVIVGKRNRATPEQLLYGNTFDFSMHEKSFDTKLDQKIIIMNKDGYLFIENDQKTEALKAINLIMALGIFHELPLYSVKEHELSQASFNKQTMTIGGMTWGTGSIRSYLFEERFGRRSATDIHEKKEIDQEILEKIIEDARIIINLEKLSEELRLFNEANTHLANSEYAQSFIMSWSVIERYFSDMWRKKLDHKDIDEERWGKLTNPGQCTIDSILEVLSLGGEIDDNDLLMELKKKRNRFYHRGKQVSIEDAKRCLILANQILLTKISNAKKGLPD